MPLFESTPVGHHDPLESLRQVLTEKGLYRKATGRILLEWLLHMTLTVGGIALCITSRSWVGETSGFLISMLGSVGVATNTHTSSHYATSNKAWVNELLTYIGYPLFLQLSATYWWKKHCVLHHRAPNVVGVDDDVDLLPWFALTEKDQQVLNTMGRFYYRVQWVGLPLLLAFNGFHMQIAGWVYVLRTLQRPRHRSSKHWLDLVALASYWIAWVVLPTLIFPLSSVLLFNACKIVAMGFLLFIVLAPAHFPQEACLDRRYLAADFIFRQTIATVNFRTGLLGRLLCSGLEFQIEHHLFPKISHVYYPVVSPHLRDFCRLTGYEHRTLGWPEAVWKSCLAFTRPKKVLQPPPIIEALPDGLEAEVAESIL